MTAPEPEIITAGEPGGDPIISLPMFGREYPLMHGGAIFVGSNGDSYLSVAIGHPELRAGLYMGLSPEQARSVAAWLLAGAAALDPGRGVQ